MAASKYRSSPLQISKDRPTDNVHSLKLVKDRESQDTIDALEYLLQEAKRGELIGLVYGGMLKGRSCIVDSTGVAYQDPLFALGVASLLTDELAQRARNEGE
ncbi:hypothetical protein [Sulfuriferula multivorans]|uniref:hypothetical protein n=1 Tax=Sulfuriferula multivorans TaxID=1559896 RepID=UPI000F5C022F|nr:hypothetical protein [Sulfuriferula multivorans]